MASLQPDPQPSSSVVEAAGQKRSRTSDASGDSPEDACPPDANSSKKPRTDDSSLSIDDFPVDSPNPFQEAFCGSDVVLVVEEGKKKLHAHKSYLTVNSPYFRVLLGSEHFAEARAQEVELRSSPCVEVTHDAMVTFLLHLYPVHSLQPIADDDALSALFPLAEYFQCQHIRRKCEAYISLRLDSPSSVSTLPTGNAPRPSLPTANTPTTSLPLASLLLYIHLCSKFQAPQFMESLLAAVAKKKSSDIKAAEQFQWLSAELQQQILQKRFQYAENALEALRQEGRSLTRAYPSDMESGCDCSACYNRVCNGYLICKPCREAFVKKCKSE